ncbi:MAG: hypothetical protein WA919_08090 [Coleofasciculaceae cyanobacterium]
MNRFAQVLSLGLLLGFTAKSPSLAAVLIQEDFSDLTDWTDLSTAVTWGNNLEATSAFTTDLGAVYLTSEAFNYTGFGSADSLRTFTALDRQFSEPIDHASNIVTIDFQAKWNSVANAGSAEAGRFIISLNHAYPEGGLDTTLNERYNDFDQEWWARPTYHLRLRSGSTNNSQGTSLLQYGGGLTSQGEYEIFDNPNTPTPDWWLPGFISGAGAVPPGTDLGYPNNSWVETATGLATTTFSNYRYVLRPNVQEIWFDSNNDGAFQTDELQAQMPLPMTNQGNAPLYQYFPTFEGIRLYWRGAGGENRGQVFLDNLTVTVESVNLEYPESSKSKNSTFNVQQVQQIKKYESVSEPSQIFALLGLAGVWLLSSQPKQRI